MAGLASSALAFPLVVVVLDEAEQKSCVIVAQTSLAHIQALADDFPDLLLLVPVHVLRPAILRDDLSQSAPVRANYAASTRFPRCPIEGRLGRRSARAASRSASRA